MGCADSLDREGAFHRRRDLREEMEHLQKTWNLKKHLLEIGKLKNLKKYLERKEKQQDNHRRTLSLAKFNRESHVNLSYGARQQFRNQSGQYNHLVGSR